MRKASRLFELIQILRAARGPVTAAQLAETLEVVPRSIYRDIAALQAMRVPIEGGRGIGYLLRPGFTVPPLMFTIEESEAIVLALALLERTGDSELKGGGQTRQPQDRRRRPVGAAADVQIERASGLGRGGRRAGRVRSGGGAARRPRRTESGGHDCDELGRETWADRLAVGPCLLLGYGQRRGLVRTASGHSQFSGRPRARQQAARRLFPRPRRAASARMGGRLDAGRESRTPADGLTRGEKTPAARSYSAARKADGFFCPSRLRSLASRSPM